MEVIDVAFTILGLCLVASLVGSFIQWRSYTGLKAERNFLQRRLNLMTRDRDEWRSVAERAILVAQISKGVTQRATDAVTRTAKS